jgi:hypothetical protein
MLEPVRIRGGDANQTYFDLEITGDGLASIEGRLVTVRLGDPPLQRLTSAQTRVIDGKFAFSLPQTLEVGLYKTKIIHFDVDGDGRCGAGDQVWVDRSSSWSTPGVVIRRFGSDGAGIRMVGSPSAAGTLAAPDEDTCRRIELCGRYAPAAEGRRPSLDIKVTGSGFDRHDGNPVHLLTRSSGTVALRGIGRGAIIGGRFTIYVPNGYQRGADQEILWFVDVDSDGKCGASAGDHLGYAAIAALDPVGNDAVEVSISDDHPATLPGNIDVCTAMQPLLTMAVTGSGFGAHERAVVYLLTRTSNGAQLAGGPASVAVGGGVSFSQRPYAYARGSNQEVLWFIDAQSGPARFCDLGTGDHVGTLETGPLEPAANGVVNLAITDNHVERSAGAEDVCAVMNGCR